jgi:sigma-E factor negative regulatory protein RseA
MKDAMMSKSATQQASKTSDAPDPGVDFSADLSAWMDGELSGARARLAYRGMMADESRRAQWARYHLIGDALRGSLPEPALADLSQSVMAHLEEAPTRPATLSRLMRNPRLWGLAASLVLASVIAVNPWHRQEGGQAGPQMAQAELAAVDPAPVASASNATEGELAAARLEPYLRNHNQALADAGEGARMLPYLSMAEYTAEPVAASSP